MGRQRTRKANALRLAAVIALCSAATATSALGDCEPRWDSAIGQPGLTNTVYALAIFDDGSGPAMYAAGAITDLGPTANNLARWDGSSWTGIPGEIGGGTVRAMEVFDDGSGPALYVGGDFETVDGLLANGLAKYDGSSWSTVGGGVTHTTFPFPTVYDLTVYDDGSGPALYLGGVFDAAGATAAVGIARWDGAAFSTVGNSAMTTPSPGAGAVFALEVHDDGFGPSLYVGGQFATVDGINASRIARWNGTTWAPLGSGVNEVPGGFFTAPAVNSIASFNGELYVSGLFNTAGGSPASRIARWDGSSWSPVGAGLVHYADSLAVFDDSTGSALYAGGLLDLGGTDYILKWDGAQWSQLDGGVNEVVWDMVAFNDGSGPALFIGGAFTVADGESAGQVALWRGCGEEPDAALSEVLVDRAVISSFGGRSMITVTPRDANGDILAASVDVTIQSSAGTLLGSVVDLGDGTYRQELEGDLNASEAVITVVAGGVALDESPVVSFVPVDPALSTITVSRDDMFVGGTATITVVPVDDQNLPVGSGFDVQIYTTLGALSGTGVSDLGGGTYTRGIIGTTAGTAAITATVDGLPLDASAALTVLDPLNFGLIVAVDDNGDIVPYLSIQDAINAADDDNLETVFVSPGDYDEVVLLDNKSGVIVEALSALEPVTVGGFIISDSSDVSLRYFNVEVGNRPRDAVTIRGRFASSTSVEIVGSTISGARFAGINVIGGNSEVVIRDSVIHSNGRNGINLGWVAAPMWDSGPYLIEDCEIRDNGHNGVSIGRDVTVTLSNNVIVNNGLANGQGGGRYGISRDRMVHGGQPQQVTLLNNTLADNNGRVRNGQSDSDIENYDQIIDATDDQSPYTD